MSDMEPGADPWLDVERRETQYPGGATPNAENSRTRADTYGIRPDLFESLQAVAPKKEVIDGLVKSEEELSDRTDLLSPLLDYRSVSTTPTGSDAMKGTGQMPFNFQIGPFKGVSKKSNVLVLDGPGLWDLRAQVTASWTANPLGKKLQVYLRVLRPDGSIFSEQAHYAETQNSITIPVVSSVCVPTAGYQVDVWAYAQDGNRGWWSGPKWTRLTAQHISRDVENGSGGETSTPPTEEPEEPKEPEEV